MRRTADVAALLALGLLVAACDTQHDLIGIANGTERPLAIVEVYRHRDIDGGLLEPGEDHFFDMNRGHAGPIEIRDERGILLSSIDEVAYCDEHPLFTVTERFLTEEAYYEVDNCQEQPVNPKRDLIETAPGVVDPRALILQARWRDPEAKFASTQCSC